jgi:hypothetical protein
VAARGGLATAVAWRIGMLQPDASSPSDPFVDAFRDGLRGLGYKEGRDILLEIRWARGSNEPLFGLAVELVALKVDVLVTLSTPAAIAAKKATAIIPIVFTAVGDPVCQAQRGCGSFRFMYAKRHARVGVVPQHRHGRRVRRDLSEYLQSLRAEFGSEHREARSVSARVGEARYDASSARRPLRGQDPERC